MSVKFSTSHSPSVGAAHPPSTAASRLVALKAQIRKRNATLGSSTRPALGRRGSLLALHQQAMELMSPESFDPFTEEQTDDSQSSASASKARHRRERTDMGDDRLDSVKDKAALHSRDPSTAYHLPGPLSRNLTKATTAHLEASALLLSSRVVSPPTDTSGLKLSRRQMRDLLAQLPTAHPALVAHSGEEEKEALQPAPSIAHTYRTPSLAALTLSSPSASAAAAKSAAPSIASTALISALPTVPVPPATPRLTFSQKRVEKFDESVKVMMSLSHSDMELIRTEILKRGGGVNRAQFLAIAVKAHRGDEGYEREVEALTEMFEEIDVNGDGDLQYSEFTSYLVELANGRYDHHHIDQLLHTDYHHLEPTVNDDRIDVIAVRWYEAIGHFVQFEKGQHRFKVLDAHKKTVKVVRGHAGEMIDCEWLPSHGVLVTSSSDRTLRFWSVDDTVRTKEGKDAPKAVAPSRAPVSRAGPAAAVTTSGSFPTFNCLSVWALPSPQVCLCWAKGRLYSADILGRLLMWNIDVGEIRTSAQAHEGRVTVLIAAAEEGALISGGMDGSVRMWDCQDLKCLGEWRHDGAVRALCWDGQRRLAISGGDDDCVQVYSAQTREVVRSMNFRQETEREARKKEGLVGSRQRRRADEGKGQVDSGDSILGLSLTREEVLVISQYGVIRVLHLAKWTIEQTLILPRVWEDREEEKEEDSGEEEADDSKEVPSLRARDLVTSFTCVRSQPIAQPLPHAFSSAPAPPRENVMVVSAGSSLYSFTRDTAVNHFIADSHPVLAAIYNPVSFTVLTAAHRSLKVWDCITGRLLKEFHDITPKGTIVSSVCLDGRGRKVIVAGSDGKVVVFNCNTGAEMQHLDQHEGEVLNLRYIEEVGRERAVTADEPTTPTPSNGVNKVLCSSRHGVYIHLDDHEADTAQASFTSLYHASCDHHGDITALTSSSAFGVIASAATDGAIIFYPANLDGTPLQKLHVGSTVTALMFLHPYRLLVAAAGQGAVRVYCVSNEQHVLIGQWVNLSPANEPCNVLCVALDPYTETLYTGDEAGCIKGWPLTAQLFDPFRALLDRQGLQPASMLLPAREAVEGAFPSGLSAVTPCVLICGHRGSVTSVGVIQGREGKRSAEANHAAAQREREVQREEDEWRESMKEAYEAAVYRTAQLLYEGSTVDAADQEPTTPRSPTVLNPQSSLTRPSPTEPSKSTSSLPMSELLTLLSPTHLTQLAKERKRIFRQLQLEFDYHFAAIRSQHAATHRAAMHHLDLSYGSPTAVLSSGIDGGVHVWSTEGRGDCLGSLQQGEVATLGKGTPAQWRFYINMEERKTWERTRLAECLHDMEEERARWKEGEDKRREEEAIARQLREEERAGREEDDDPNDTLPHNRAATREQKKLMDRVEEEATDAINSPAFQAKVRQPPPAAATRTALPPVPFASSNAARPGVTSTGGAWPVVLPPISPTPGHRSQASMVLDEVYTRSRRSSVTRRRVPVRAETVAETPSLRLSRYQQMKAAVAKAVPLHRPEEVVEEAGDEEEELAGGRPSAPAGANARPGSAQLREEKKRLARAIVQQVVGAGHAKAPAPPR